MHHRWAGRYDLRLGTHGDRWLFDSRLEGSFLVARDGRSIEIVCAALPPRQDVIDVLLRRILPRVAALSPDRIVLHAAGAAMGDQALLLLGESGAGKSTTLAYLAAHAGWHALSEDYSVLAHRDAPAVEPGPTGLCLWEDTGAALALPAARCRPMPGYDGKLQFEPEDTPRVDPTRLAAFVFLERAPEGERATLTPMTRGEALIAATRQSVLFDPSAPAGDEMAPQFGILNAMLSKVPACRLRYPAGYGALAATGTLLETLLRP